MPHLRGHRPELMTVDQVADYLQLNRLTVYKYIRDGRLPAARLGKAYRIRLVDVDAFLERQMSRPGARPPRAPTPRPAARRQSAVTPTAEEIAVAPQWRESPSPREGSEVSINPMEWVIRGLH